MRRHPNWTGRGHSYLGLIRRRRDLAEVMTRPKLLRAPDAPPAAIAAIEGAFADLQRQAVAAVEADLWGTPIAAVAESPGRPDLRLVG